MVTTLTIKDTVWAYAEGIETETISDLLRFKPKGYTFAPSYNTCRCGSQREDHHRISHEFQGRWDGWIKLTRLTSNGLRFPAGLVPYVLEQPWANNIKVTDNRVAPNLLAARSLYSNTPLVALDAHQEQAVQLAIAARQGIIQYPTGTGKGRIIGEVIRRLNLKALVICDKLDLLKQLRHEVEQATGQRSGVIGGGQVMLADVVVSTYQSLIRVLDDPDRYVLATALREFPLVIVDEGHHAEAKSLSEVLQHIPAFYRLGFSATAFKSYRGKAEGRGTFLRVQSFLGPPIDSMTVSAGIDTGRIVPPDIFIVHGCEETSTPTPINYKEEYHSRIINNQMRNRAIIRLVGRLQPSQTVVLVQRIAHGDLLSSATGFVFIDGSMNPNLRADFYDKFKRGEVKGLIIGKVGDEALDLPNIEVLILAGGGDAPHIQIQRVGRGLRASAGKERVMVFDFEDYGKYISKHYKRRRRTYDHEAAYTVIDIEQEELLG